MDRATLIAFGVTFVAGPALCALCLRLPPRPLSLALLAVGVVGAVSLALWLQVTGGLGQLWSVLAMWLAWVLAIAMVALAFRRRITGRNGRRWLTLIAILATTLPWFGMATARMMV